MATDSEASTVEPGENIRSLHGIGESTALGIEPATGASTVRELVEWYAGRPNEIEMIDGVSVNTIDRALADIDTPPEWWGVSEPWQAEFIRFARLHGIRSNTRLIYKNRSELEEQYGEEEAQAIYESRKDPRNETEQGIQYYVDSRLFDWDAMEEEGVVWFGDVGYILPQNVERTAFPDATTPQAVHYYFTTGKKQDWVIVVHPDGWYSLIETDWVESANNYLDERFGKDLSQIRIAPRHNGPVFITPAGAILGLRRRATPLPDETIDDIEETLELNDIEFKPHPRRAERQGDDADPEPDEPDTDEVWFDTDTNRKVGECPNGHPLKTVEIDVEDAIVVAECDNGEFEAEYERKTAYSSVEPHSWVVHPPDSDGGRLWRYGRDDRAVNLAVFLDRDDEVWRLRLVSDDDGEILAELSTHDERHTAVGVAKQFIRANNSHDAIEQAITEANADEEPEPDDDEAPEQIGAWERVANNTQARIAYSGGPATDTVTAKAASTTSGWQVSASDGMKMWHVGIVDDVDDARRLLVEFVQDHTPEEARELIESDEQGPGYEDISEPDDDTDEPGPAKILASEADIHHAKAEKIIDLFGSLNATADGALRGNGPEKMDELDGIGSVTIENVVSWAREYTDEPEEIDAPESVGPFDRHHGPPGRHVWAKQQGDHVRVVADLQNGGGWIVTATDAGTIAAESNEQDAVDAAVEWMEDYTEPDDDEDEPAPEPDLTAHDDHDWTFNPDSRVRWEMDGHKVLVDPMPAGPYRVRLITPHGKINLSPTMGIDDEERAHNRADVVPKWFPNGVPEDVWPEFKEKVIDQREDDWELREQRKRSRDMYEQKAEAVASHVTEHTSIPHDVAVRAAKEAATNNDPTIPKLKSAVENYTAREEFQQEVKGLGTYRAAELAQMPLPSEARSEDFTHELTEAGLTTVQATALNGQFDSMRDLKRATTSHTSDILAVDGIGPATLDKLRALFDIPTTEDRREAKRERLEEKRQQRQREQKADEHAKYREAELLADAAGIPSEAALNAIEKARQNPHSKRRHHVQVAAVANSDPESVEEIDGIGETFRQRIAESIIELAPWEAAFIHGYKDEVRQKHRLRFDAGLFTLTDATGISEEKAEKVLWDYGTTINQELLNQDVGWREAARKAYTAAQRVAREEPDTLTSRKGIGEATVEKIANGPDPDDLDFPDFSEDRDQAAEPDEEPDEAEPESTNLHGIIREIREYTGKHVQPGPLKELIDHHGPNVVTVAEKIRASPQIVEEIDGLGPGARKELERWARDPEAVYTAAFEGFQVGRAVEIHPSDGSVQKIQPADHDPATGMGRLVVHEEDWQEDPNEADTDATEPSEPLAGTPSGTVALVGCGKQQADEKTAAKDLYSSDYFQKKRAWAEKHADDWFILSAKHGVVDPDAIIAPYDRGIQELSDDEQRQWGEHVVETIRNSWDTENVEAVMLAGRGYREPVEQAGLGDVVARVRSPFEGTAGIGEQIAWLNDQIGSEVTPEAASEDAQKKPATPEADSETQSMPPSDLSELNEQMDRYGFEPKKTRDDEISYSPWRESRGRETLRTKQLKDGSWSVYRGGDKINNYDTVGDALQKIKVEASKHGWTRRPSEASDAEKARGVKSAADTADISAPPDDVAEAVRRWEQGSNVPDFVYATQTQAWKGYKIAVGKMGSDDADDDTPTRARLYAGVIHAVEDALGKPRTQFDRLREEGLEPMEISELWWEATADGGTTSGGTYDPISDIGPGPASPPDQSAEAEAEFQRAMQEAHGSDIDVTGYDDDEFDAMQGDYEREFAEAEREAERTRQEEQRWQELALASDEGAHQRTMEQVRAQEEQERNEWLSRGGSVFGPEEQFIDPDEFNEGWAELALASDEAEHQRMMEDIRAQEEQEPNEWLESGGRVLGPRRPPEDFLDPEEYDERWADLARSEDVEAHQRAYGAVREQRLRGSAYDPMEEFE